MAAFDTYKDTKFSAVDAGESVKLSSNAATDPTGSSDYRLYRNGTDLYWWNGSSAKKLNDQSGGGGGAGGLDGAYSAAQNSVTMDEGPITLTDATAGALNTLVLVKSGAGSGNLLDMAVDAALTGNAIDIDMNLGVAAKAIYIDNGAGARTGSDLNVKSDSTGTHSVIDIDASGSGAVTGFDFQGSYNGSPAGQAMSVTFDANDNLDTKVMLLTTNAGARGVMFDLDLGHTDSGTTSHVFDIDASGIIDSNIFDFATSAACTGNVINIVMDNAVGGTALRVAGAGVRTEPFIELIGTQTGSADMIDLSADGAFTGDVLDIDMNAAVGGRAINIDVAGARTAALMAVTLDGTFGSSAGGTLWDINVSQTGASASPLFDIDVSGVYTGNIFDYASSAASTGHVFNIDMDANLAGSFLVLDYGNGTRTEDMIQVTFDGAGTAPFWDINITNTGAGGTSDYWDIDVTGVYTGSILDIAYSSAAATGDAIAIDMGTAVAASALVLLGAGARTDDMIKIDDSSTGNSHIFDINMTGAYTGNILDISFATAAATGEAIQIVMGTNVSGSALVLTGTGSRTDDLIKIDDDSTGNSHTFDINFSGAYTGNCLDVTYATAAATGNALDLNMGTNVEGMAISVNSAATGTSGEGSALDVVHSGNLAAGADVVRIESTGSPSATSHVLAVEQTTGAGLAGSYALYVNATGANVEGLKVDAGNVVFDENLTVSGTLSYKQLTEVVTSANVITAAETGSVFFLNAAAEFASTLPAPAAGLHFTFIVTGAPSGANYTITTNNSDNIILGQVHSSTGGNADSETSGADTINFVDGSSVVGDTVQVWCDGTNWFAQCFSDADGGITITTAS